MTVNDLPHTIYVNSTQPSAAKELSQAILSFFSSPSIPFYDTIIILCIGTDRCTGDCLGPLVGYKLKNLPYNNVHVIGTLEEPVHAKNLAVYTAQIKKAFRHPLIIAVDACLGKAEHVGFIAISNKPIKPGAGLNKDLPEIGDISIAGIVNSYGLMDYVILQNTRLNTVMKMSDLIASGIKYVLWKQSQHLICVPDNKNDVLDNLSTG
ncbi:MAG: spore protease YyaC [Clostridiaceae bacterium]|nr:spore protease YyaC [Clostridiaceae bacterium]